jgi:PEP-CTERM motif
VNVTRRGLSVTLAVVCLGLGVGSANATVTYSLGNMQFTQVNINADVTDANPNYANPLTAYINDAQHTPFYFANPLDTTGGLISFLHGSHGVAAVEAWQCDPTTDSSCKQNAAQVPFFQMDLYITDPSVGITGMDWALDAYPFGTAGAFQVQFTAYTNTNSDGSGGTALAPTGGLGSDTFTMTNGQNQYFAITVGAGESFSRLHIAVLDPNHVFSGLSDIKQVSVEGAGVGPNIPEPGTLALLGLGMVGLAASRRRKLN